MSGTEKDEAREYRISMEIIVDAYDEEEQAMGWYYYLQDNMQFPFPARCVRTMARSPLHEGEQITVIQMAPENECLHEMIVEIQWQEHRLSVPLVQLQPLSKDKKTREAVADWHYWIVRGYRL